MVWPRDDRGVYYPSRNSEHAGVVVAPRWAVEHARGVFLANAPAVTNAADGGDEMSLDICRPEKGDVGDQPPVIPAPKTAPTVARVVKVPVPTRSTCPPRPPFDELELVAANVAHAKAAKDQAAAKKRHAIELEDLEDDEDNDDQDSDDDLDLASLRAPASDKASAMSVQTRSQRSCGTPKTPSSTQIDDKPWVLELDKRLV
eukprot:jgi/Tetstr1/429231/TSEL_001894.t1